ncbi:MAG: hypothetical protein VX899_20250 [Myxococcota bacterium]|nr:hypothetical protein [Myxococcota bacterium]
MIWLLLGIQGSDVKNAATAWVTHHNAAIGHLEQGEPQAALQEARTAVAMAPDTRQKSALEIWAISASAAGAIEDECNALDRLSTYDKVKWELYWNGALDAQANQMWASAYRFAVIAWERSEDKEATAPLAFSTAMQVGQWDMALATIQDFENPLAEKDLTLALADAGQCEAAWARQADIACTPAPPPLPPVVYVEPEQGKRRRR